MLAMQYQVFVQNQSEQSFIASVVGIPNLTVEGKTEKEAIAKVKAALESQLAIGKFIMIDINPNLPTPETDPWLKHLGLFANDPTFDDFLAEVAAYRQSVDAQEIEA
jgi:predicted RNase H-like HicB family nuclease